MNSSPGRRTEEAQQSAGGCPREPKDAKSNRYPVISRPNSGKILEGIFPSMGLKNRALWAPIFYPVRADWLAKTCVKMAHEDTLQRTAALPRSASREIFIKFLDLFTATTHLFRTILLLNPQREG